MSLMVFQGSLELGIIYAIMVLGVFISFRTLNMPDLTVDGSFVSGAAVSAVMCTVNAPYIGLLLSFVVGCGAGCITALLHTKLKIQPLLAGILTMLALYSINLKIMLNRPNIPLLNNNTIFSAFENSFLGEAADITVSALILLIVVVVLFLFLKTRTGIALRATGDNSQMVRTMGVNTDTMMLTGLAISNGLVALSGGIIAQYQSFADISMGTGMVVIGLASVIIGEVIFGTKTLMRRLISVILGAILYRMVIAVALELGMPPTDMKLVSAVIVILALASPTIKEGAGKMKRRFATNGNKGGQT